MRQFAASTHPGYKRKNNEDCYVTVPDLELWLVADGVGGHASGEVASAIVGATLRERVAEGDPLVDAIIKCHEAVLTEIRARNVINDMGSTVVALKIAADRYEIGWVGDSRAYLWDGALRQLTRDHNPVSELLARGTISPEEASTHPERHVLTQSLGVSENMLLEPGWVRGELGEDQQILLCSDGLTDEVPDPVIARLMASAETPQAQVDALVEAALDAGGRDNITVVVVGGKLPPPQTQSQAARITQKIEPPQPEAPSRAGKSSTWLALAAVAVAVLALGYWLLR